jgi:hypothetical protein
MPAFMQPDHRPRLTPSITNMQQVRDAIAVRQIRDGRAILSSINKLVPLLGPLASIPVAKLRARLNAINPEQHRENVRYWAQIKSRCLRAIRLLGLDDAKGRDADLLPEWRALYAQVPDPLRRKVRADTVRLAKWATRYGLAPYSLTEKQFGEFQKAVEQANSRFGRNIFLSVCNAWDRASGEFHFWPKVRTNCAKRRLWFTRPMEKYPRTLREEIAAMIAQRRGADPEQFGWRSQLSESGELNLHYDLRRFLHYLCETGVEPGSITSLSIALSAQNVRQALNHACRRAGHRKPRRVYNLAVQLRAIAINWLRVEITEAYDEIVAALYNNDTKPANTTLVAVLGMDDPVVRKAIFLLPREIFCRYASRSKLNQTDRASVTAAVALDLSIKLGLPMTILSKLRIGADIRLDLPNGAVFLGSSSANRASKDYALSSASTALLALYLDRVRHSRHQGEQWLFPGLKVGPRNPIALGRAVTRLVKAESTNKLLARHLPHLAGRQMLQLRPGDYDSAGEVMGRKSSRVAEIFEHLKIAEQTEWSDAKLDSQAKGHTVVFGGDL